MARRVTLLADGVPRDLVVPSGARVSDLVEALVGGIGPGPGSTPGGPVQALAAYRVLSPAGHLIEADDLLAAVAPDGALLSLVAAVGPAPAQNTPAAGVAVHPQGPDPGPDRSPAGGSTCPRPCASSSPRRR